MADTEAPTETDAGADAEEGTSDDADGSADAENDADGSADAENDADGSADAENDADGSADAENDVDAVVEELFARAEEKLELIASKPDEEELGPVLSLLDDLEDIADEAEDVVSTADLTDLAGAIDWGSLPDAFELADLPDAAESGDGSEVVTLRKLVELVDLPELWQSVDARELWREKREFENEVDDLTGDGNGDGGDENRSVPDVGSHDVDPESLENAVQSGMSDAVDTFRSKLIDAHERIRAVREANRERFPDHRQNNSRNPTAVTTMPARDTNDVAGAIHSSVPEETRYSTAPNRRRIYGNRFEKARDDDG